MNAIHDVPWAPAGQADPTQIKDARLQAHWAVQIICPVGAQLVPPKPDFGHTALSWSDALGALVTQPAGTPRFRAALRLADCTVMLLDEHDHPVAALALAGHTVAEGLAWLTEAIGRHTGEPLPQHLTLVGYTMQSHPVKDGARFAPVATHLEALAGWYRNAANMLAAIRAATPEADEVRAWPHHFDVATLATFDGPDVESETARSLGFGLSPGDETYAQPYWYVLPWPAPPTDRLTPLAHGHWHTEGFVGAVLTGLHEPSTVADFFRSADRIGRAALGVESRPTGG